MTTIAPTPALNIVLQEAIAHHQAGRLIEAEQIYRTILQTRPEQPDANHNLGVLMVQAGLQAAGLQHLKTALESNPSQGQYWLSYTDALLASCQATEALIVIQTAIQSGLDTPEAQALLQKAEAAAQLQTKSDAISPAKLQKDEKAAIKKGGAAKQGKFKKKLTAPAPNQTAPTSAELNQIASLFNAGHHIELENRARLLIERYPDSGFVWKVLGASLQIQRKEALPALQKATKLLSDDAEVHNNLGNALKDIGRLDDAVASYRRALAIKPDLTEAYNNLGFVLRDLGRLDDAVASYRRALEIKPDFAIAHNNLGLALRDLGRLDDAVASFLRALEIKPDYAPAHSNLGNALRDLGRLDDAVASCCLALEIKPDLIEAHNNLGNALGDLGRLDDAVASFRRALEIKPDYAIAHLNLGNALEDLGQLDDAIASFHRALEIKPDYAEAYSNLLFLHGYHALLDPREYLSLARGWEQACVSAQDRQAAHDRTFQRPPLAGRRLRVGYVSGDYRQHAVSYFLEQLFIHHDRARIELFAYSNHGMRDAVTERLQAMAEHWIPITGEGNAAIMDRIGADSIDVLVDLSGHTAHNRLEVFARRAAPVQVTYLGYFASTGLTEMNYFIGDKILTPPEMDNHFSEQAWRLPRVWVSYDGKADTPVPDWRPAGDGSVWLGSFNNLGKLTSATLALWARVLHALPEGRLLLKTKELADANNRRRILDTMADHGIPPDRIELRDRSATPDWFSHMAYYDRMDIALDPVGGVGGGTTTCDALWMGVPVITLEGDRMASRMTASMLNAIGHSEWIARSEAEYIDKVVALARGVEQRKALRPAQRARMASSPLCNAKDLAVNLENAYFEMFERWFHEKSHPEFCRSTG